MFAVRARRISRPSAALSRRWCAGMIALLGGPGIAVGIAACGQQYQVPGRHLDVSLLEYRLRPDQVDAAAGTLTVAVHNLGRLTHDLVIIRPTATTQVLTTPTGRRGLTTTIAGRTPDLAPGTSTTLAVHLAPGVYSLASNLGNDQGEGMQGSLTVTSK